MKRVILIATLLVCIIGLYAQNKFYYGYTQKIFLEETSYAVVMNEGQNNSFLSQSPGIKVVSNNNAYTIVEYIERDSLKGSVFPVYKTQDGVLLGCTDELVFSLKKGVDVSSILKQYPIEVLIEKPFYVLAKIKTAEQNDVLSIANRIMESGLVNYSHPNFIAKVQRLTDPIGDPYFSYQFYLHSYGQLINDGHYATPDADINALEAWEVTKGNSSIKVAVIDEGVTNNHPDIPSVKQIRLQGSNFAAPYDGTDSDDPSPVSDDNHGNACSGIICAEHNNEGIAGIAPNCKIMPIRIPYGYIPATVYADAIDFAVNNGADIISNSWGYGSSNPLMYPVIVDAIKNATVYGRNNKGCVVSFAAGNTADRVSLYNGFVTFPANCGNDTMIVVGASERTNHIANYSPSDNRISVVAPSHKAYSSQIQGEDFEVWSIDIPGQSGYNPDPYSGVFLPNSGTNYLAYTGRFGGTSAACPQVAGVAALILSVNSNLSAVDVKKIIESTTKKIGSKTYQNSSSHPNGTWNDEMGYGLVDAYAAVKRALGYPNDLYVRDTVTDDGTMPSSCYSTWDSPDIEVVDTLGHKVANLHGNTKYAVRVRIHNRRDVASSGTERLFLNWAKAGFNDSWDEYWTSDNPLPCGAPKGGVIGSANGKIIPSIPANSYRIDTIHWITPAGVDYANCTDFNYNKWHFCLLARIHDDDVIAHENEHDADVHQLVKNHNNVAQQNVYLDSAENYRKTLGIGNVHTIDMSRIINLSPKVIGNISITNYAEVYITLDAGLLAAINSANISGLTWVNSNTLRWNGGNASIPVTLPANSYYTLQTTVHFLADQIPASNNFDFDMVLRSAIGDSILGGEHYRCVRTDGRCFQATAHDNMTVLWGETATLYADDILETAEYKWYDDQGNEVGSGLTCNVTPQQNTTYTLRVTADADGYRAYSTVDVMVVDGELRLLAPNPADNQVRIGYALSRNISAATLQILNGSGQVVHIQALSGGNGSKVTGETLVNTSSMAAGSYTVRLVTSNGKVHDSRTLVVR